MQSCVVSLPTQVTQSRNVLFVCFDGRIFRKRTPPSLRGQEIACPAHNLDRVGFGAAIIDFAQRNQADHIVMGARGTSGLRRYLGSVSSQVVAESDCSVTVVRQRRVD